MLPCLDQRGRKQRKAPGLAGHVVDHLPREFTIQTEPGTSSGHLNDSKKLVLGEWPEEHLVGGEEAGNLRVPHGVPVVVAAEGYHDGHSACGSLRHEHQSVEKT